MATDKITVNGASVEGFIEAEKSREIEEHRQAEVRLAAKQAAKHHGTKPEWCKRGPGRPSRVWDLVLWARMQVSLSHGKSIAEIAAECGIRRSKVRRYLKHYCDRSLPEFAVHTNL